MNALIYVAIPLINALSTVPVTQHVSIDARPTKKTANHSAHAMKTVPRVVHAQDGAVNFHVTQSGQTLEIVAKISVW